MSESLGNIAAVSVRNVWQNEQYDFTPWLAEEENIKLLGEAIGLELEVENTEVAVGPYSADIVARDVGTGDYVVIENQFGKTNHDHLGKVITYGSALNASAIVWLAEEFTEEHRRALDWLSDHTTDDIVFFGVAIELLQIDDSRPAVRFNVASRPADTVRKEAVSKASDELSDTRKLQLEFWHLFRERLLESKVVASAQSARPQYWFDVALGRSSVNISNIADTYGNRVGIRVYLAGKVADAALDQLGAQREAIEAELGEELQWNPNPDNRDKIIATHRHADLTDRDSWSAHCDWLVDMNRRFLKTFGPRVKKLDLNSQVADDGDDTGADVQ